MNARIRPFLAVAAVGMLAWLLAAGALTSAKEKSRQPIRERLQQRKAKTQPMNNAADAAATTRMEDVPLIPRKAFFGNPEKARARISPDGKQLAFVAPVEGVLNVWVGPADKPNEAKPITFDKHRGIMNYFWAFTNKHILYVQDKNGDEDNHVYAVNLANNEVKDLTPIEKIAAQIENVSEKFPEEILVGINDRDERQFHDIYKINILTGNKELIQQNPGFA